MFSCEYCWDSDYICLCKRRWIKKNTKHLLENKKLIEEILKERNIDE